MLIIRNAQRVAFLGELTAWTIKYLLTNPSAKHLTAGFADGGEIQMPMLREKIEWVFERGLAAGIDDTRMLFRLITITLDADATFLHQADAVNILNNRARSAESRLDALAMLRQGNN